VLGEGGADAGPGGGDGVSPLPGCVDAQADLSGAAGEAGGHVQDPVAEGLDLAARQSGFSVKPISLVQATRSVAVTMISSQAAWASKE
jgi:hypothetical protein